MTAFNYETEALMLKNALKAAVPGKVRNATLTPDAASFRYEVEGHHTIAVVFISSVVRAHTEGMEALEGGISWTEPATEDGVRRLTSRLIERLTSTPGAKKDPGAESASELFRKLSGG